MATHDNTTSRRRVLGALAALPAVAAAPALAQLPPDRSAWERALAASTAAHRKHDAYYARVWTPACELVEAACARLPFRVPGRTPEQVAMRRAAELAACPQWDAINDEADRLTALVCEAEAAMIATPAPDGAALLCKLEHLLERVPLDGDGAGEAWTAEYIAPVMADARRLLGGEV